MTPPIDLLRSPGVASLAAALGVRPPAAFGLLCGMLDQMPGGQLEGDAAALAAELDAAAGVPGAAAAAIRCGLLVATERGIQAAGDCVAEPPAIEARACPTPLGAAAGLECGAEPAGLDDPKARRREKERLRSRANRARKKAERERQKAAAPPEAAARPLPPAPANGKPYSSEPLITIQSSSGEPHEVKMITNHKNGTRFAAITCFVRDGSKVHVNAGLKDIDPSDLPAVLKALAKAIGWKEVQLKQSLSRPTAGTLGAAAESLGSRPAPGAHSAHETGAHSAHETGAYTPPYKGRTQAVRTHPLYGGCTRTHPYAEQGDQPEDENDVSPEETAESESAQCAREGRTQGVRTLRTATYSIDRYRDTISTIGEAYAAYAGEPEAGQEGAAAAGDPLAIPAGLSEHARHDWEQLTTAGRAVANVVLAAMGLPEPEAWRRVRQVLPGLTRDQLGAATGDTIARRIIDAGCDGEGRRVLYAPGIVGGDPAPLESQSLRVGSPQDSLREECSDGVRELPGPACEAAEVRQPPGDIPDA
jgi:hypothetical protein